MDNELHRHMIKLSNNSTLTGQAAAKLSKALEAMEPNEKRDVLEWFRHAEKEQNQKIHNAERKFR